jgi:hypothetical protein
MTRCHFGVPQDFVVAQVFLTIGHFYHDQASFCTDTNPVDWHLPVTAILEKHLRQQLSSFVIREILIPSYL